MTEAAARPSAASPTVYAILVNYNGWADTLECLESLLCGRTDNLKIIVCDNGSTDGSMEQLKAWAEGRLDVWLDERAPLRGLSFPPCPKPVPYRALEAEQLQSDGTDPEEEARLILIRADSNLGFAGGSNLGLAYAQAREDFRYAWILNNDTVVRPDTLDPLVRALEAHPQAGICGATVLEYDDPARVQLLAGGTFYRWLGMSHLIGKNRAADAAIDAAWVTSRLSFVSATSMLVSKAFIESVGPLSERYFLFFEEIDWVTRARGCFDLVYAPESRLYHKLGSTIRSRESALGDRHLAQYYLMRSALIFARTYQRHTLPSIYACLVLRAAAWALIGKWSLAKTAFRVIGESVRSPAPR